MRIKKALEVKVEIESEGEVHMMVLLRAFLREFQIKI
jgi:hypothetical protein